MSDDLAERMLDSPLMSDLPAAVAALTTAWETRNAMECVVCLQGLGAMGVGAASMLKDEPIGASLSAFSSSVARTILRVTKEES